MTEREISVQPAAGGRPRAGTQRRAREAQRRRRKRARMLRRCALLAAGVCLAAVLVISGARMAAGAVQAAAASGSKTAYAPVEYDVSGYVFNAGDPFLLVVNGNLPLAEDYPVDTAVADDGTGKSLQSEAAAAYRQMAAAAKADGVELMLCSGYRDYAYQQGLFEKRKKKYLAQGLSDEEADARAATIVARPGTSEHATGLAADIVTPDYQSLDTGFADTQAYAWLCRYAPEYGFILRYPQDRQAATGIVYEPWHWRYVGVENAKAITQSGLSLEEFVALHQLGA